MLKFIDLGPVTIFFSKLNHLAILRTFERKLMISTRKVMVQCNILRIA